jgi:hypothetical protein
VRKIAKKNFIVNLTLVMNFWAIPYTRSKSKYFQTWTLWVLKDVEFYKDLKFSLLYTVNLHGEKNVPWKSFSKITGRFLEECKTHKII